MYHINDFKVGDIYEWNGGRLWEVTHVNKYLNALESKLVNGETYATHQVSQVKHVWFFAGSN